MLLVFIASNRDMGNAKELASSLNALRRHQRKKMQRGATTVEFAFAMLFLFFFFIAYTQIVEIFLAHERLTYAAFLASRAHQVHGSAYKAASSVDSGFSLETEKDAVTLSKYIPVPIDFKNPFVKGAFREAGTRVRVSTKVATFEEERVSYGDN